VSSTPALRLLLLNSCRTRRSLPGTYIKYRRGLGGGARAC
jgi:hypothetical protein